MNSRLPCTPETARYFEVGAWIEHQHMRGEVVALDFRARTMELKVMAVNGHGPRNRIGRRVEVPFDCGTPIERP